MIIEIPLMLSEKAVEEFLERCKALDIVIGDLIGKGSEIGSLRHKVYAKGSDQNYNNARTARKDRQAKITAECILQEIDKREWALAMEELSYLKGGRRS